MKRKMFLAVNVCLVLFIGFVVISPADAKKTKDEKKAAVEKVEKMKDGLISTSTADKWEAYTCEGATIKIKSVKEKKGDALEISYDMGSGTWVGVRYRIDEDLSNEEGIRITYRGEGNMNTLELKLEDGDGSNFGVYIDEKSNPEELTTVEIPFSEATYWWGGDENLDLSGIMLHFAISIKEDGEGGSGKIFISEISKLK